MDFSNNYGFCSSSVERECNMWLRVSWSHVLFQLMSCIIHAFTNCTFTTFLRWECPGNEPSPRTLTHWDCSARRGKKNHSSFIQHALCPHRSPPPPSPPPMSKNRIHLMSHQWINRNPPTSPTTTTIPTPTPPISNAEGGKEDSEGLVAASSLRRPLLATVHDNTISFQSAMSTSQRGLPGICLSPVKCLCFQPLGWGREEGLCGLGGGGWEDVRGIRPSMAWMGWRNGSVSVFFLRLSNSTGGWGVGGG